MKITKIALASAVIAGIASSSFATLPAMAVDNLVKENTTIKTYTDQDKRLISSSIRLYSEPDSTSASLSVISRNSLAYSKGETSGSYTKVTYNGITGWAETRFVKDYVYNEAIEAALKPGDRTIIASITVTDEPDSKSSKVTSVVRNSKAYFTGDVYDKFSKIQVDGMTGWVESRFVVAYDGQDDETEIPVEPPVEETDPPITENPDAPDEETTESSPRNVQITASVGIHKDPDSTSDRVSSITRLSYAKATGEEEGKYSEIVYKGAKGWVESRFVKDYDGELPEDSNDENVKIDDARRTVTASIRLYETPEAEKSLATITRNSIVTITGKTSGKFTESYYEGKQGWVESRFVKEYNKEYDSIDQSYYTEAIDKTDSIELGTAGIFTRFGYIHNEKKTTSTIIAQIGKYSEVKVLKISEGWASVTVEDKTGWIKVSSLGEQEAENYDKWRTATQSVVGVKNNARDTKFIRHISAKQVVKLTGYKDMGYAQVRYRNENSGALMQGWVKLEEDGFRKYNPKTDTQVASNLDEKKWKDGLPKICQDVEIFKYSIVPNDKTSSSYRFSTKLGINGAPYYEITIDGDIDPMSERGRAIMKHECGHVLMTRYDQSNGRAKWVKFLERGWDSSYTNRVELLADAIADELGADRKSTRVGYTHSFTPAQRQIAKELVDMYAADGRGK